MTNEQINKIVIDELNNINLGENIRIEPHPHRNSIRYTTRIGHERKGINGKKILEYSHPHIYFIVYGLQSEKRIREIVQKHFEKYSFLTK